ncbi:MAG: methylmalonyl Co-A mutase-associated GTPase MeaB [Synergistaceae bacterium]|nr:methylmalonyl Co-A mutase-associated GTPase MeaB [Synergistaceae bacterium]
MHKLTERALSGDIRAMARLISMAEDRADGIDSFMKELYPYIGRTWIIGVTGSPGAGKSTLADKLIEHFRERGGVKVGVLAIDPSSPYTGGAILADRLRMQRHTADEGVYMRSLAARGSLGGLSRGTREAASILDACGFGIVIIETVGVGQSEIDVMRVADTVCVILAPGLGDDVQAMKAGIMEIADIFVVNKADKPGADRVVNEVRAINRISAVVKTVAETGDGVPELGAELRSHWERVREGEPGKLREAARMCSKIEEILAERISESARRLWAKRQNEILPLVLNRQLDPYSAADIILSDITFFLRG